MKQIFGVALCCLVPVASTALAQPAKLEIYQFVPSAEQVEKLKQDPFGFYSQMLLRGGDNNLVMTTARDKSGEAESHALWNDVIFVQAGEATMPLGGTMENPPAVNSGEMRGSGISGAKTMVVHAGDVVHAGVYVYVPVNTAHRLILSPGESVRYAVVKTRP